MDSWFGLICILLFFAYGITHHLKPEWFENTDSKSEPPEPWDDFHRFFRMLYTYVGDAQEVELPDGLEVNYAKGVYRKRGLRLSFRKTSAELNEVLEIRIPIQQKFWLHMNRQRLQEEDADEIQTGHAWLDREYVIQTNHKEAAEDFLRRHSVKIHFSQFPCTFDRLEIIHGEMILTLNDPRLWKMQPYHLTSLLEKLNVIITDYEDHKLITLQISAPQGTSRCPYCRSSFEDSLGNVIRCNQCSTRLHESCWNENQQCTTWGCRSTVSASVLELQ
jgi:hypothetical protein